MHLREQSHIRHPQLMAVAVMIGLVVGCGQKGPLYLPDETDTSEPPPAVDSRPRMGLPDQEVWVRGSLVSNIYNQRARHAKESSEAPVSPAPSTAVPNQSPAPLTSVPNRSPTPLTGVPKQLPMKISYELTLQSKLPDAQDTWSVDTIDRSVVAPGTP